MTEIELFPNVTDRSTHSNQPLNRIMQWATTNDKLKAKTNAYRLWLKTNPNAPKAEKSAKKVHSFPALTFAGTFTGTGLAKDINIMSGMIVLDIDHINNMTEIRQRIELDKYTYLVFTSPSNDGLKIIIKHNLTNPDEWKYLYNELELYYKNTFGIDTDKSGKDISRMCFLPFIENLYTNDNSEVWQYTGAPEAPVKAIRSHITAPIENNEPNEDLYKECFYLSAYLFENKIDLTSEYHDWILYGFSLCSLGEQGREIFHNISCGSDKYNVDNCNYQFNYSLENYDPEKTGIDFFLSNAKTAIVNHLLFNKYGFIS